MPPKRGMPNRRGLERREQILDAATELFARRGYRATGLVELAERVGMSHVGVLHHFGTKENLLREVMARRDRLVEQRAAEFQGKGIGYLVSVATPEEPAVLTRLATVLRAESLDPDDPLHEHFERGHRHVREVLAAELRSGQERGEIRSDIDPDVKALEIIAFAIGIETQWVFDPSAIERAKVRESFFRALLDDLTRPDAPRMSRGKSRAAGRSAPGAGAGAGTGARQHISGAGVSMRNGRA